jgi:hypothetical protein
MGRWDALSSAMRTPRNRRIGSREAEQLLAAAPGGSTHPELSRLLGAAAAPPRPDELAGLRTAVAAFEAAGLDREPVGAVTSGRRIFARSLTVKVAAGAAVALLGGTALAAGTGNLPSGAQRHAHDAFAVLGVPPPATPDPTSSPAGHVTPTGAPSTGNRPETAQPGASRTTASQPGPPAPSLPAAAAFGLCRAWAARQKKPKGKPMNAGELRKLAAAAAGADHIAAFCAPLLAGDQDPAATTGPATGAVTPSHPGKGNGRVRTTPKPHKNG